MGRDYRDTGAPACDCQRVVGWTPTRGNQIFNIFISSLSGNETKLGVESCHFLLHAMPPEFSRKCGTNTLLERSVLILVS